MRQAGKRSVAQHQDEQGMNCALLWGAKDLSVKRCKRPKAEPDWTVVRVKVCGICGSDFHVWQGHVPLPKVPVVLGHEFAGEVYEADPLNSQFQVGDRVAIEPIVACGQCALCRAGKPNLCRSMQIIGWQLDGAYAEYVRVPTTNLVRVSPSADLEHMALADCFAVSIHAISAIDATAITSVGVVGDGMIGLSTLLVVRELLNPSQIVMVGKHDRNLHIAKSLGATDVITLQGGDLKPEMDGACDLVFEAVGGSERAFGDALTLTRPGGHLALLGLQEQQITLNLSKVIHEELTLLGVHAYGRSSGGERDFVRAVHMLEERGADVEQLISHRVGLSDVNKAFEWMLDRGASQAVKILITSEGS